MPASVFAAINYSAPKAEARKTGFLKFLRRLQSLVGALKVDRAPSYIASSTCPHSSASYSPAQLIEGCWGKDSLTVVHRLLRYGACRSLAPSSCSAASRCSHLRSYGLSRSELESVALLFRSTSSYGHNFEGKYHRTPGKGGYSSGRNCCFLSFETQGAAVIFFYLQVKEVSRALQC